jgi:hypothetical protein
MTIVLTYPSLRYYSPKWNIYVMKTKQHSIYVEKIEERDVDCVFMYPDP